MVCMFLVRYSSIKGRQICEFNAWSPQQIQVSRSYLVRVCIGSRFKGMDRHRPGSVAGA